MKTDLNKKLNKKGQALLETLLVIPILFAVIFMISFTSDIVLTKQQLLMAARYGTDLIYYTKLNEDQVKSEVLEYLCGIDVKGRKVNIPIEQIYVHIDRFPKIRGVNITGEGNIFNIVDQYFKPEDHTSHVEIKYKRNVPNIVSMLNSFFHFTGQQLPKEITVSARSEVLAGTGA